MIKIHVEVFVASRLLGQRQEAFTAEELRREIEQLFGDMRPGVSTHISAHCVANAPRNAPTVYNYLWRLDHGNLCPFDSGIDRPHPSRADAACLPPVEDVPPEHVHLLSEERPVVSTHTLQQYARLYAQDYTLSLLGDDEPRLPHAGDGIRARGYLRRQELDEIARWKSPRRAGLVQHNPEHVVEEVTRLALALKDTDPRRAIHLLTVLDGVQVPTASAVLTVADPQDFGIIDIRAWRALSSWQPDRFPWKEASSFSIEEFLRYLETVRDLAQNSGLSCREVDMALWRMAGG
jgi:hypothetical protein